MSSESRGSFNSTGVGPRLVLAVVLFLVAAVFLAVQVAEGNYWLVAVLGVAGFLVLLVAMIERTARFGARLLTWLVCGYLVAGKGFAYLSPFPPIYIGEVALAGLMGIMIFRMALHLGGISIPRGGLTTIILIFGIYGSVSLLFTIREYKIDALKDFATIYYAAFFFLGYAFFSTAADRRLFFRLFPIVALLGVTGYLLSFTAWSPRDALRVVTLFGRPVYWPHGDTVVPLAAALAAWFYGRGIVGGRFVVLGAIGSSLAIGLCTLFGKMAFGFSYLFLALWMLFAGQTRFVLILVVAGILGGIAVGGFVAVSDSGTGPEFTEKLSSEISSLNPDTWLTDQTGTSGWRMAWWKHIAGRVIDENPAFGLGLGSDFTTSFYQYWAGPGSIFVQQGVVTRYPHNIIFTILGRLGFVGLALLIVLYVAIALRAIEAARLVRCRPSIELLICWSYVVAGLMNGLVQMTFESPYAAIPFWTFLGLGVRMLHEEQLQVRARSVAATQSPTQLEPPSRRPGAVLVPKQV